MLSDNEDVFFTLGTLMLLVLSVTLTLEKCIFSILRKPRIY